MTDEIRPPGLGLRLLEGRAGLEAAQLMMLLPFLRMQAKRGAGEPVLVLPGFMADDSSTMLLRRFLDGIGYRTTPWELGINSERMLDLLPPLAKKLEALASDQPVRLVGWSRGGILARELARDMPELVDRVVTVGSPVKGGVSVSSISALVKITTGMSPEQISNILRERQKTPISVPIRAIYSKSDGVVAWKACIDDENQDVEHFEISGSHVGMGSNADVFRLLPKLLSD